MSATESYFNTWDYRVMRTHNGEYVITEAHYNSAGNLDAWTDAIEPTGDSPDELRADLTHMLRAFDLPVLDIAELEAGPAL